MGIATKTFVRIVVAAIIATIPGKGQAGDNACPSADDVPYSTQVGETWAALGGRAYCLDGPNARSRAALALYEYNRGRVGPRVNFLPDGTTVCLPKHLHGPFFDAERCQSAPVPPGNGSQETESTSLLRLPPAPAAVCGNGQREADEVCDGNDLNGATCASYNLTGGALVCRTDCRGVDARGCSETAKHQVRHEEPPAPTLNPKRPDEPSKSAHLSLRPDVAGGIMFPTSTAERERFYGAMGLARVGGRMGVGPVEVALHGIIGGGTGTTIFNDVVSELNMFIAGGGIQVGVPFKIGAFRFTPGAELLRLYMQRKVQMPAVYKQDMDVKDGGLSLLGAFLRSEYQFARAPRLAAGFELSADYVPRKVDEFALSQNFQMKALCGVSYAAF